MAPFVCCGFRRPPSPDDIPIRVVDNSARRFTISTDNSILPSHHLEESESTRKDFTSANTQQSVAAAETNYHSERDHASNIRRKESIKRLRAAANRIKKRISHDSGASGAHPSRTLRSMTSMEDVGKRNGGRHPHQDLFESEILDDQSEIYDEDAVPIGTPRGTWLRQEGSIPMSPNPVRRVIARSSSPLQTATKELKSQSFAPARSENAKARALSRMLTERGSRLTDTSTEGPEMESTDFATHPSEISEKRSPRKYVFRDDASSSVKTRSPSPLDRSGSVIRSPSTALPSNVGLSTPMNTFGSPPAPYLNPTRLASISDSVAGRDWRLSYSDKRKVSQIHKSHNQEKPTEDRQPDSPISEITAIKAPWMQGASGRLASPPLSMPRSWLHTHCDPEDEEENFGGLDGKDSLPRTRTNSDGSNRNSVHLYDMRISQRLASHGIVPVASSPQLKSGSSSEISWGFGAENLSLAPRRQASSSGLSSEKILPSWGAAGKYVASSVYTASSRHESLASNQLQLKSISQTASLKGGRRDNHAEDQDRNAFSKSSTGSESMDLDKTELLPLPINIAGCSKGLKTLQIEAPGGESFPPKEHTVVRGRYFSQADLNEMTQAIALRIPPRKRSVSYLDGRSEGSLSRRRVLQVSSPQKKPSIFVGDGSAEISVWEKALRDHVEEDAKLSKLKAGSVSIDNGSKSQRGKRPNSRKQRSSLRHISSSSVGLDQDLQARLGEYELPQRQDSRIHCQSILNDQRIPSSYSTSSWYQFPNHSRPQRSESPANQKDNVFARDFAAVVAAKPNESRKEDGIMSMRRVNSAHFKRLRHSLKDMYRAKSMELFSKFAVGSRGHRSSISEGGLAEYPELEMLPSLSPPYPSKGGSSTSDVHSVHEQTPESGCLEKHETVIAAFESPSSPISSARNWSRLYEDCVVRDVSGGSHGSGVMRHPYTNAISEHFAPIDMEPVRLSQNSCCDDAGGDDQIRTSTLDFKRSLEENEHREREKVLRLRTESEV